MNRSEPHDPNLAEVLDRAPGSFGGLARLYMDPLRAEVHGKLRDVLLLAAAEPVFGVACLLSLVAGCLAWGVLIGDMGALLLVGVVQVVGGVWVVKAVRDQLAGGMPEQSTLLEDPR